MPIADAPEGLVELMSQGGLSLNDSHGLKPTEDQRNAYRNAKKEGRVRKGERDHFANSMAYELRMASMSFEEAEARMRHWHSKFDQPPGDEFTWESMRGKLTRVWEEVEEPESTPDYQPDAAGDGNDNLMKAFSVGSLRREDRQPAWLIKRIWPHPGHGMIGGMEKSFKSWLMVMMATAVASDQPLFQDDRFEVVTAGPVLFFTGESGRHALERRIRHVAENMYSIAGDDYEHLPVHVLDERVNLTDPRFVKSLGRRIEQHQPVAVVIDPVYAYIGGSTDAGNVFAMGEALHAVSDVCNAEQVALIAGHHLRKTGKDHVPTLTDLTQAGGREWVKSWILLNHQQPPDPQEGRAWLLSQIGNEHGWGQTYEFDLNVGRFDVDTFTYHGDVEATVREADAVSDRSDQQEAVRNMQLETDVLTVLQAVGAVNDPSETSERGLERSTGMTRGKVRKAVDRAIREGLMQASPGARKAEWLSLTAVGRSRLETTTGPTDLTGH